MIHDRICPTLREIGAKEIPARKVISLLPFVGPSDPNVPQVFSLFERTLSHRFDIVPREIPSNTTAEDFNNLCSNKTAAVYHRPLGSKNARIVPGVEGRKAEDKVKEGRHGISTKWALLHPWAVLSEFVIVDYGKKTTQPPTRLNLERRRNPKHSRRLQPLFR
ncbi:MAG TPA: hypothetical protein VLF89_07000 [Candidatus Saccharimonadales bacterium]|nr:hypothetical protein [Candidatus Saccharimonadales bacterium]